MKKKHNGLPVFEIKDGELKNITLVSEPLCGVGFKHINLTTISIHDLDLKAKEYAIRNYDIDFSKEDEDEHLNVNFKNLEIYYTDCIEEMCNKVGRKLISYTHNPKEGIIKIEAEATN